jgi:hypothetical protein
MPPTRHYYNTRLPIPFHATHPVRGRIQQSLRQPNSRTGMTSVEGLVGPHELRSERNFQSAVTRLREVLPEELCVRLCLDFPNLEEATSVDDGATQLEMCMEQFILAMDRRTESNAQKKVKTMVTRFFVSSYPFAKALLLVAKDLSNAAVLRSLERD